MPLEASESAAEAGDLLSLDPTLAPARASAPGAFFAYRCNTTKGRLFDIDKRLHIWHARAARVSCGFNTLVLRSR